MNFRILTDSCCDLPYDLLEKENVQIVSMVVTLDGKEYEDDLGKTFSSQWLIKELQQGKLAATSQINIGVYLEKFKEMLEENQIPIIYLGFSSGLSGSYSNAVAALDMLNEEKGSKAPIHLIDSKQACLGEGMLVKELIDLRNQQAGVEEALDTINQLKTRVQSWVTVDDLKYLERGGRISKTTATVGSLMNIKPIIVVNDQGKLINQGKVRGRRKSLDKLVEQTKEHISIGDTSAIYIAYAGDIEAGEHLKESLSDLGLPIEMYPMGPTIACHTGAGALAVFSIVK
ncbi:DegV family protein [Vagococcus elongatus]|uniref:Fatty acid-binding protein DegV n=1 Tax=Vagococcus elongatus TaxID=180344 RepID=A0A430AUZ3_9ENTE|nr:DegV family protein [Vagococcus elongatus]RSU11880.1 fatty acid-binding protein DegV [Vagococcus elongatus]